jgi:hypothetical protein
MHPCQNSRNGWYIEENFMSPQDNLLHGFSSSHVFIEQECPTMYIEASQTFNLHASKTQQRI